MGNGKGAGRLVQKELCAERQVKVQQKFTEKGSPGETAPICEKGRLAGLINSVPKGRK